MTFRYRSFAVFPATLLVTALLASAMLWWGMPDLWRIAAVLPLPAAAAGVMLWLAQREEAWKLGAVHLDGAGVRRVRGDGRVIDVVRWDDLRSVVIDFHGRQALLAGPGGASFWVRGVPPLGGVGLEDFHSFLELLPDYTSAPIREVARARQRPARLAGERA